MFLKNGCHIVALSGRMINQWYEEKKLTILMICVANDRSILSITEKATILRSILVPNICESSRIREINDSFNALFLLFLSTDSIKLVIIKDVWSESEIETN